MAYCIALAFILLDESITTYTIGEGNIMGNTKSDYDGDDKIQMMLFCLEGTGVLYK